MKFKFSIVMAVYNASQWINEAIDSVINQTIGFENIELILVDDWSIDSSKEICKQYKNEYPDNIKYYYKKNGGQASARNLGLNFLCRKPMILPIPVARPAKSVRPKAKRKFEVSIQLV